MTTVGASCACPSACGTPPTREGGRARMEPDWAGSGWGGGHSGSARQVSAAKCTVTPTVSAAPPASSKTATLDCPTLSILPAITACRRSERADRAPRIAFGPVALPARFPPLRCSPDPGYLPPASVVPVFASWQVPLPRVGPGPGCVRALLPGADGGEKPRRHNVGSTAPLA